jgi:hypothetical protein
MGTLNLDNNKAALLLRQVSADPAKKMRTAFGRCIFIGWEGGSLPKPIPPEALDLMDSASAGDGLNAPRPFRRAERKVIGLLSLP